MVRIIRRNGRGERGLTIVEVLVALALLALISLGILAMFSASVTANMGALAKTDLIYRCQRVAETIRVQHALSRLTSPTNNATCCPLTDGTTTVPPTGCSAFWGSAPNGAAVTEANAPFALAYTITTNGAVRDVTVTAQPTTTGTQYLGAGIPFKAVTYATQIPSP
jgi:type II secretory pathway pseudopilin PulG